MSGSMCIQVTLINSKGKSVPKYFDLKDLFSPFYLYLLKSQPSKMKLYLAH